MGCFFHDWGPWEIAGWRHRDRISDDNYGCWLTKTCRRCDAVKVKDNHDWHTVQDQEGFCDTYCRTCRRVRPQPNLGGNGW